MLSIQGTETIDRIDIEINEYEVIKQKNCQKQLSQIYSSTPERELYIHKENLPLNPIVVELEDPKENSSFYMGIIREEERKKKKSEVKKIDIPRSQKHKLKEEEII